MRAVRPAMQAGAMMAILAVGAYSGACRKPETKSRDKSQERTAPAHTPVASRPTEVVLRVGRDFASNHPFVEVGGTRLGADASDAFKKLGTLLTGPSGGKAPAKIVAEPDDNYECLEFAITACLQTGATDLRVSIGDEVLRLTIPVVKKGAADVTAALEGIEVVAPEVNMAGVGLTEPSNDPARAARGRAEGMNVRHVPITIRLGESRGTDAAQGFEARIEGLSVSAKDPLVLAQQLKGRVDALAQSGTPHESVIVYLYPHMRTCLRHVAQAHRASITAGIDRVAYTAAGR